MGDEDLTLDNEEYKDEEEDEEDNDYVWMRPQGAIIFHM